MRCSLQDKTVHDSKLQALHNDMGSRKNAHHLSIKCGSLTVPEGPEVTQAIKHSLAGASPAQPRLLQASSGSWQCQLTQMESICWSFKKSLS